MSPSAPRKVCLTPGCGALTSTSYCEKHALKRQISQQERLKKYDEKRGTKTERGYNSKWSKYSVSYRHANPLCVKCLEVGKLTNVEGRNGCVDHIKPVNGGDDPLFWEPSNHQSLCWTCHSIKTSKEDGGFGNMRIRTL